MSLTSRISDLATRIAAEFKTVKTIATGTTNGSLTGLATTVKTSLLAAINELKGLVDGKQANLGYTPENAANKGAANGYASLDGTGKVPAAQLPAFVDDVLEFANLAAFPATGSSGLLYIAIDTNIVYRWSGTGYVATNGALALGITSSTAFRGDYGQIAYLHSSATNNPHGVTWAQLVAKPTTIATFGITDAYTKAEIGTPETDFAAGFVSSLI